MHFAERASSMGEWFGTLLPQTFHLRGKTKYGVLTRTYGSAFSALLLCICACVRVCVCVCACVRGSVCSLLLFIRIHVWICACYIANQFGGRAGAVERSG